MQSKVLFLFCSLLFLGVFTKAQGVFVGEGVNDTLRVATINLNGESVPWIVLNEVVVWDQRRFSSKEEFDKYRRLRYNVIKVLPYARYAGQRYRQLERDLATTS